jgi:hypothetical protein
MDIDLNPPETETQEAVRLQGKHMETVEDGLDFEDLFHLSE